MPATIHALQSFFIGDDWIINGALTDELNNPIDPTPATSITWKLDDETGQTNLFTLTKAGGGIVVGSIPNSTVPGVIITLPAASTTTLTPGTFRDQLRAVIGGQTSTYWQGPIQALQQLS